MSKSDVVSTYKNETYILDSIEAQRNFFKEGKTKHIQYRKDQLLKLKSLLHSNENSILKALKKDLGKHEFEAYATEIGITLVELDKTIKKIHKWSRARKVKTPPFQYVAKSYIQPEPYGNVLVIAPWNYPVQLLLLPMIGAIAAGNTVLLKPSEYAIHTTSFLAKLINENFDKGLAHVIEGAVEETQLLLQQRFDYIFFTGSTKVGKIVYQHAAKHLTPVTLELGGKSPCIVDADTHLDFTAKRIVWGKFLNCGQTCIAPDYLLVDNKIKDALMERFKYYIQKFYGNDVASSDSYGRIINELHFDRLTRQLESGDVIVGGQHDKSALFIAPTLMENLDLDSDLMNEEIFGPILPVIGYNNLQEALDFIHSKEKPLAMYIFSKNNRKVEHILNSTSCGGATINDTIMHIVNDELPFGGVGASGIGAYHGKSSFDLFSNLKSVLHRSFLVEEPFRYAPYKYSVSFLKKLMDWTL